MAARITGTQDGQPGFAFGLAGISDWSVQQPFLDVFKTTRDWLGHTPTTFGAMRIEEMQALGLIDTNGYLVDMPDGISHVETFVLTEITPEATYMAGRYRLEYNGSGDLRLGLSAQNVTYGDQEIWFDYVPDGTGLVAITIHDTDPTGTGDYLRDFRLVKETDIEAVEAGAYFREEWLDTLTGVHALRFMDWMETNNSSVSTWTDRVGPNTASWANGVPVEVMVHLANLTGTEPWFTIPHNADNAFVQHFATYVRDNLDPSLRAHFEFSNEVWNFQFQQAQDSLQDAIVRFGGEAEGGWMQEYGIRAAEISGIIEDVYRNDPGRMVSVFATHTHWKGLEFYALEAPAQVAAGGDGRRPAEAFDTYAITGYFDGQLGSTKADIVLGWIEESRQAAANAARAMGLSGEAFDTYLDAHKYDQAVDLAVQELRDGSVTGNPGGSLQELFSLFAYHKARADAYGMDLVMYEGGTHVVGIGARTNDATLTEFFTHLNYSAGMGVLYDELLAGWVDAGGSLFNAFVDVDRPGQWGSWGALRHLEDTNPRNTALTAFRQEHVSDRDPVEQGLLIRGTTKEDQLQGSERDDTIVGSGGNDVLIGGAGQDLVLYDMAADDVNLTVTTNTIMLNDRSGGFGTDNITDMNALFLRDPDNPARSLALDLDMVRNYASIDSGALNDLTELYIATFDRAPDAPGLAFWAAQYANAMPLSQIAAHMIASPEAQTRPGATQDAADFVDFVYMTVLGRAADPIGKDYWTAALQTGSVERSQFVLELLNGVSSESDARYLQAKTDIGISFAVIAGRSNVDAAYDVIDTYNADPQSAAALIRDIQSFQVSETGEFTMPIIGIWAAPDAF